MHIKTTDNDVEKLKLASVDGNWKVLETNKQRFLFQKICLHKMWEHPDRSKKYLSIIQEIADFAKDQIRQKKGNNIYTENNKPATFEDAEKIFT